MTLPLRLLRPIRAVHNCTGAFKHVRYISLSLSLQSGHNRWSKIKHDKGKIDDAKTKARSSISKELLLASKLYGPDPNTNARLGTLIAAAKKIGFPKASIEAAIARGQGISASGAALENLTIEFMLPDANVAAVIECQTDNKARTMQDVREALKHAGATVTPTAYMFDRRGKIVFEKPDGVGEEEIMDKAIEAGAVDVEVEEGEGEDDGEGEVVVVWTEPNEVSAVGEKMAELLGSRAKTQELVWEPKEDLMVEVKEGDVANKLERLMGKLEDESSVQGIYLNTT